MTFQEWQATRQGPQSLGDVGVWEWEWEGERGYVYDGGFIAIQGEVFIVPMPQSEETFATLAEAETYLWAEWCQGEING